MFVNKIKRNKFLVSSICIILIIQIFIVFLLAINLHAASIKGVVPEGFGNKLLVGLHENPGDNWMKDSKIPWNSRYIYLVKGWTNNWGWASGDDGSYALDYMNESSNLGSLPILEYYFMNGLEGGGEESFYKKTQNANTMKAYFSDFKILMQAAKKFAKPVIILIEADGFAFLENQTKDNPNAQCAIKSTGISELADIPNTAAGWGMAFLQIKKAVGATNAMLAMHLSGWASEKDVLYSESNIDLQPEVDKVYKFLAPLGLKENQTGLTYDFLVSDPLDRDADYYKVNQNQNRWLDASDQATINSQSYNRYAQWLKLWNEKSNKKIILWQIPLGNSNSSNTPNNGNQGSGYKDNKTEYFFGKNSKEHLTKFINCGVVGLLFGPGAQEQATYKTDTDASGNLYLKTKAAEYYKNGGLSIN